MKTGSKVLVKLVTQTGAVLSLVWDMTCSFKDRKNVGLTQGMASFRHDITVSVSVRDVFVSPSVLKDSSNYSFRC
jgi:hypothetical protein